MKLKSFKHLIFESNASVAYEQAIEDSINNMNIEGLSAKKAGNTKYSDVKIKFKGKDSWLEVKMNHTDNLMNQRVFFDGKKWDATSNAPAVKFILDKLNNSDQADQFIADISKFSGIKNPIIPTTKSGLSDKNAVPLDVMKSYFDQPGINRYIMRETDVDLGSLVTEHYTKGKAEPAYYLQAADDFYMISNKNPFNLPKDIPILRGLGNLKVRISTRSQFYEVQPEVKITNMNNSDFSIKPGTRKINPFEVNNAN